MTTMTRAQYERLRSFAVLGGADRSTLYDIDTANGIARYTLLVRYLTIPYRETDYSAYPPGTTVILELDRKPEKNDVLDILKDKSTSEDLVYVTADPTGTVGWTLLVDYVFA